MNDWQPHSWQNMPYEQSAEYPNQSALDAVVDDLSQYPPLVTSPEVEKLKSLIAKASRGDAFVLQGGDCAESFADCNANNITNKLKIILQMSLILIHGLRKPVVRIGRIAGQYAKPRSSSTETKGDVELPSYRGDLVNCPAFDLKARTPNPKLLLKGYSRSAMTLNYLRALLDGGFADLHKPQLWDLDFVKHSAQADEYQNIVNAIEDSLEFIHTIKGLKASQLNRVDFFTSHEALHLHYEQALTREIRPNQWYNLSTHFPWVGMRTAKRGFAHLEYLRGIRNPIGIKVGAQVTPEDLLQLIEILNPLNEEGRLTLITRFGVKQIKNSLPSLIKTVQDANKSVLWMSDPMHGNTHSTQSGIKTRHFDDILGELEQAFEIHHQLNSHLGGVHFELTGDDVTECTGGARGLNAQDLSRAYKSLVDPRLNYEQSLEMALCITRSMKGQHGE